MPSSASTVRFPAPLRRASLRLADVASPVSLEELETTRVAAYQQGFADASEFLNQQLAEQRADVIRLMEQTLKGLDEQRKDLWNQMGSVLPGLAIEIARRVLSGMEPDRTRIERTVDEVLNELSPGTRDIEIAMHSADLELLGRYEEKFQDRYPGLRFVADASLTIGDCRLRSGFGFVDATISTKLETLHRALQ